MKPKKHEARDVFQVADEFLHAVANLAPLNGIEFSRVHNEMRAIYLFAPEITCAAFALELFLKSLWLIDKGSHDWTHDLWDLYRHLDVKTRERIEKHYSQPAHYNAKTREVMEQNLGHPITIEYALKRSRLAFKDMRYMYQGSWTGWLGFEVALAARQAILDIHPDWGFPRDNLPHSTFVVGEDNPTDSRLSRGQIFTYQPTAFGQPPVAPDSPKGNNGSTD